VDDQCVFLFDLCFDKKLYVCVFARACMYACMEGVNVFIVLHVFVVDVQEHKKILYFHPQNVALDTQISNIGLCEAVMKFTQ